jgi:hypothetical protein
MASINEQDSISDAGKLNELMENTSQKLNLKSKFKPLNVLQKTNNFE